MTWERTPSLPVGTLRPFLPLAGGAPGMSWADLGGVETAFPQSLARKWYRAQALGFLTPLQADDICTFLGVPTASIYSAEWSA